MGLLLSLAFYLCHLCTAGGYVSVGRASSFDLGFWCLRCFDVLWVAAIEEYASPLVTRTSTYTFSHWLVYCGAAICVLARWEFSSPVGSVVEDANHILPVDADPDVTRTGP